MNVGGGGDDGHDNCDEHNENQHAEIQRAQFHVKALCCTQQYAPCNVFFVDQIQVRMLHFIVENTGSSD